MEQHKRCPERVPYSDSIGRRPSASLMLFRKFQELLRPMQLFLLLATLAQSCCSFANAFVATRRTQSLLSAQQQQQHQLHQQPQPRNTILFASLPVTSPRKENHRSGEGPVGTLSNGSKTNFGPNTMEKQICNLGRRGQTDAALKLFESIQAPTVRQYNAVLDACARARPVRLGTAQSIFQSMHVPPNVYTFGALMNAVRRAGDIDLAIQILADMPTLFQISPNNVVVQSAIATAAVAVRPDIAVELLRNNPNVTVIGYNAALDACAKAGEYRLALEIYQNMTLVDSISIGTVMAACETAAQWELVLNLADDPRVDCLGLTSALHACQQLNDGERALTYLNRMKRLQIENTSSMNSESSSKTTTTTSVDRQSLQGPDRVAYRLAISACARSGMWKDGISLLKEYTELFGGDVLAYTAVMTGLEYAGEWEAAVALLGNMRKNDISPTDATFVSMIGACANAVAKQDNKDGAGSAPKRTALQLLRTLRNDKVVRLTAPVYNAVIRVCAEALDLRNAIRVFEDMLSDGLTPTIVTFGTLMTACERTVNLEYMYEVFDLMDNVYKLPPNRVVYGAAMSCCRKSGNAKAAYQLYERMQNEGLEISTATLNTVLAAMVANNNNSSNQALVKGDLDRALDMIAHRNSKTEPPNRQTFGILIRAMASARRPRDAEQLLREMRQQNMVPDVDLYTATVASYERTGQPLRALRLMEEMRAEGYDFYEPGVLNTAFKNAVKVANALGQRLASTTEEEDIRPRVNTTGIIVPSTKRGE